MATFTDEALKLADVVVVDVQCDYLKESLGNVRTGAADMAALEASLAVIAKHIPADALVLIETTVAPGTTEQVAYPIMKKIFEKRGNIGQARAKSVCEPGKSIKLLDAMRERFVLTGQLAQAVFEIAL